MEGNIILKNNCKRFRHEPDWTPNNYDVYMNPAEIPSNIQKENAANLVKKLKKLMPPTKRLHVHFNIDPETISTKNTFKISSSLKFNNKKVKFK